MRLAMFLGRITRDIELKHTPNGNAVANFGMAINEKYKDKEETNFFDFVIWSKGAETLAQYASKGMQIMVECKPQTQTWNDKDSGKQRSKVVFNVQHFHFVDGDKKKDDKRESQNEFGLGSKKEQPEFQASDIPF